MMAGAKAEDSSGRIVMAGLPPELESQIARRLPGVKVEATGSGSGVLMALAEDAASILILDHGLREPSALDVLRQVRRSKGHKILPVIYCLGRDASCDLPPILVRKFGVGAVLYHPLDAAELIRQAANLSGIDELSRAAAMEESDVPSPSPANGMFEKFASLFLERIEVLERAGGELLEGHLSPELRSDAEREAHRLAGSLGTVGLHAGSRFAREAEGLLQQGTGLSEQQALRFSELVVALRMVLERQPFHPEVEGQPVSMRHRVLLLSGDEALSGKLRAEALARGLELENAPDIGIARNLARDHEPVLAILDPRAGAAETELWEWLDELGRRQPPVPGVVLTGKDTLLDRVEVARRGGRGFLPRSLSVGEVMDFTLQLAERLHASATKVLAVDDDPQVLDTLRGLLESRRLQLTVLDEPLKFWEVFGQVSPDLVILDVDMPHLTGIELCRVIRNDPHWAEVPILFLTAYSDAMTIQRVFTAGADDFVAKPVAGPELLARILNRLDRSRLLRSQREVDPLTGIFNRRKARVVLDDFIRLAHRHGQPLALGVVNLDHLRQINERYGYAAGDAALRRLGRLIQRHFRREDVTGRWGGEDLVVGMYGMRRSDGVQRLSELLQVFRAAPGANADSSQLSPSFSAGVAAYPEDASEIEGLFAAAWEAMRAAKAEGRDRVLPAGWDGGKRQELTSADVVLVMDDEAHACLLTKALETRGYRTRWLQDGKTAIKLLAGPQPRLQARVLLMEVELSGMDGLSLLKRLAAQGRLKESRVIMLTSPSVGDDAQSALRLGAFDQIAKPFNPPVVVQRIRRALERL